MAWIFIRRESSGRPYIGSAINLDARFAQHLHGYTATTKRVGGFSRSLREKKSRLLSGARRIERLLKQKKEPKDCYLLSAAVGQLRKLSEVVKSSTRPVEFSLFAFDVESWKFFG
jgi:predicted GIY-YIG superfamily endonuclease